MAYNYKQETQTAMLSSGECLGLFLELEVNSFLLFLVIFVFPYEFRIRSCLIRVLMSLELVFHFQLMLNQEVVI